MRPNAMVILLLLVGGQSAATGGEFPGTPSGPPGVDATEAERWRIGLHLGVRQGASNGFRINGRGSDRSSAREHGAFGFHSSRWLTEDLAVTLAVTAQAGEIAISRNEQEGEWHTTSHSIFSVLLGVRKPLGRRGRARPWLAVSAGPFLATGSDASPASARARSASRTVTAVGGHVGAGVDYRLGESCILGLGGGYNLVSDFAAPVGGRVDYSGFEVGVGISWTIGAGDSRSRSSEAP